MPRHSNRLASKPRLDYKKYNSTGMIVAKGKTQATRVKNARATAALATAIRKVVRGQAETKMATWYSGGTNPLGNGARTNWAAEPHNAQINSNTTDIMRLVPVVAVGTGDNQRIGERISPSSFIVNGVVSLNLSNVLVNVAPLDIVAVIYVLQHKSLKTYNSLQTVTQPGPPIVQSGNDFTQLLLTGEGDTVAFDGHPYDATLPVADQYYKLCAKKLIPLRYAGSNVVPTGSPIPGGAGVVSVANSHTYSARYTFNLKKHIPNVLKYQESAVTTGQPGDPLNSSIFMCIGYYRLDQAVPGAAAFLSNSYVATLKYKDM
nr:coat protein [Lake Sarah-associated circular virus-18]